MEFRFDNIEHELDNLIRTTNNIVDISNYNFIEPVGMAILYALYEDIGINLKNLGPTNSYVNVMFNKEYDSSKNYIPIEKVRHGSIEKNVKHITAMIIGHKDFQNLSNTDRKDLYDYLYYMIGEVLNNALHHSLSPIGAIIAGQYFPNLKKIQICVVDRGVGFLSNLKRKYNVYSESEAIKKALEKEVSCPPERPYSSSQVDHAGYGLFVLSEIIKHTQGKLKIISNDGAIYLNENGELYSTDNISTEWKGSIVVFEFYEKNINLSKDEFFRTYIFTDEEEDIEDIFY